jgi:predicted membrane protein
VLTVPEDVALEIDANAGVGEVNILGERDDGFDAHLTRTVPGSTPDAAVLDVELDVAIGGIEVRRG